MWDPILVTLMKMQPHYNQSSRVNATPSSGTSQLASITRKYPRLPRKPTAVSSRFVITFGTDEVNQTDIMSTR